jgi:hypothetical protein
VSNKTPVPSSSLPRRFGRLATEVGGGSPPIEGMAGLGAPTFPDDASPPAHASQPASRVPGVRRPSKRRKNGNWIDAQLASALAAFDSGMNMKQASEQFHIPYSSFREHCYGMQQSRVKGAKEVLLPEEE